MKNAYGSVHHSLIDFSLRHYHAPLQFLSILKALYSGLNAKVITSEWETPVISLQKGVYQGDPLSVVIFNTVMNTLVDTVTSRIDLGYQFSKSTRKINILQYADDTCLVADSPASCQSLLSQVSEWLKWSGMEAKIPKCQCITLQGSTGKLMDPDLTLNGSSIPFTTEPIRFLGLKVQVPTDNISAREEVLFSLERMLDAINKTPLTRKQKMCLYFGGVCPRLTWPLLIQKFPTSWMEQKMDAVATQYLKKWSGLGKSANIALVYLPGSMGGLNLPRLSVLHKKLQVSRQCQLLVSRDSCVRFLADCHLKCELIPVQKKFKPAEVARDAMKIKPGVTSKTIVKTAKVLVRDEANTDLLEKLHSQERQGQMSRCTSSEGAPIWAKVVQSLPEEQMKFALNAAVDVLPHNANLHLWKKRKDPSCPL